MSVLEVIVSPNENLTLCNTEDTFSAGKVSWFFVCVCVVVVVLLLLLFGFFLFFFFGGEVGRNDK